MHVCWAGCNGYPVEVLRVLEVTDEIGLRDPGRMATREGSTRWTKGVA